MKDSKYFWVKEYQSTNTGDILLFRQLWVAIMTLLNASGAANNSIDTGKQYIFIFYLLNTYSLNNYLRKCKVLIPSWRVCGNLYQPYPCTTGKHSPGKSRSNPSKFLHFPTSPSHGLFFFFSNLLPTLVNWEMQALAYRDKAEISCYSLQISMAVI